jgi:hypothetical protein
MTSLSLQKSIQGCKVITDWANRQQSDRFLNSNNLLCPLWNGLDLTGRPVCPDSYVTKTAGCNNPLDRVMVENEQRPKYFQYLTLNAAGLEGGAGATGGATGGTGAPRSMENYIGPNGNDVGVANRNSMLHNAATSTPSYGQQLQADLGYGGCSVNSYERAMASMNEGYRYKQAAQHGYQAAQRRQWAGM